MSILKAVNLVKGYRGRTVVGGISLALAAGEIIGLLGRNGAGKTTTFRMMAGLVRPDHGRIELDGVDISSWTTSERAGRGVVYLPQEESVFLRTTAGDNLRMIAELRGFSRAEGLSLCRRLLDDMGLASLAGHPAHSLSGGEKRKLEIARALLLDPQFLLLDEPFMGVDPLAIQDLQKRFLALRDRGIGLVVSDHNVRETFRVVSRAYIIDGGMVLAEGSPKALAADERVRLRFLGRNFRPGGEVASTPDP